MNINGLGIAVVNRIRFEKIANIRHQLISAPLAVRLQRTNFLGHSIALIQRITVAQRPTRVGKGAGHQGADGSNACLIIECKI